MTLTLLPLVCACCALLAACDNGKKAPLAQASGDAARGKLLMAQYQCGACHAIAGVPAARGVVGPSLDGYGRRSYIAGHIPNAPEALARWIVDPAALKPGTSMPAMGVSPDDARDMAAYLTELR
ncbi:cytochrome C [Duganella sp. Leaf126]|uniref:c-type cytochrome n=1 Tax=Duganella sp. Leaf126 TaxID=1736266 RepID=UPI0006FBDBC2|nr:c-type cytochrome [Duganella sp. Leaf126]KQQ36056.1 cytochrome C [Duganella sp. Leaf126]